MILWIAPKYRKELLLFSIDEKSKQKNLVTAKLAKDCGSRDIMVFCFSMFTELRRGQTVAQFLHLAAQTVAVTFYIPASAGILVEPIFNIIGQSITSTFFRKVSSQE